MKTLRLVFVVVLLASSLLVSQASGRVKKRSAITPARHGQSQRLADDDFIIECPNGRTATCTGTVDDCLFLCDVFCGTPAGTCEYVEN